MDVRDVAPGPAAAAWPRALDHAPPQRRHEMEVSRTLLIGRAVAWGAPSPVRGTLGRRELQARALVLTEGLPRYSLRCGMCSALAAVEEASRAPPPGARAARKSVNSSHPRGRTPSGLERKEGIVSSKLNVFALLVVAVAVTVAS